MEDPILGGLNPPQLEAVTFENGPCLIVAGAGSGKTRVITRRVAWLIRDCNVRPESILCMTFTNKAADEMKYRVLQLVPNLQPHQLRIGTFHSQCAVILRREYEHVGLRQGFIICDDNDQLRAMRHILKTHDYDPKRYSASEVIWRISQAKIQLQTCEMMGNESISDFDDDVVILRDLYDKYMLKNNAVDFDDLITYVVQIFHDNSHVLSRYQNWFKYIMVDEYQDTNLAQFELVRLIAGEQPNLMVVGDEDQSIYGWRGADIKNILEFGKHYPDARIVKLEQNYRSTKNILNTANAIIANNVERLGKKLFTENEDNTPIFMMTTQRESDEASEIAALIKILVEQGTYKKSEFAIFYRVNALSRGFEEALRSMDLAYKVIGGTRFYDRAEIRDLIAYMQVIHDPKNSMAFGRILNIPRRGIGEKAQSALAQEAAAKGISDFEVLSDAELRSSIFGRKAYDNVVRLLGQIDNWRNYVAGGGKVSELLKSIIDDIGYYAFLNNQYNEIEAENRIGNLNELYSGIKEMELLNTFQTLGEWLERVSLSPASEDVEGDSQGRVSLMTMHAAKGLEFSVVFLVGVEDTIFPSMRTVLDGNIEEERRLLYVGVTRARERLVISRSASRLMYGDVKYHFPSVFLSEIPAENSVPYSRELFLGQQMNKISDSNQSVNFQDVHHLPHSKRLRGVLPLQRSSNDEKSGRSGSKYSVGQCVRHPLMGDGEIVEVFPTTNTITIQFQDGRTLKVLAKYTKLEVLDD